MSALRKAAGEGRTTEILTLLEEGVDANAADEVGNTSLIYAVKGGHLEAVEVLLQQPNVDIQAINTEGLDALGVAMAENQEEIAALIQAFQMSTESPVESPVVHPVSTLFGKLKTSGLPCFLDKLCIG